MPYIRTTALPSTDLFYLDVGEGLPVVLIHGWPLSHRMWESQVNALLDAGYRVVAYDRRGFGESGRPAGGYDYDTFASDLADLLTQLDLTDVTLVGFSMGGGEVARYIGRYGLGRVVRAAFLGAVPPFLLKTEDNPDGVPAQVFEGMIAGVKKDRIAFLDQFFPNFYNVDPGTRPANPDLIAYSKWIAWGASPLGTQQCITAFGSTDFRDDLAKISIPTLILHGDDDRIVPLAISGAKTHEAIKGSVLEVIRGAPHGFAATHADALNRALIDFLGTFGPQTSDGASP